MPLPRARTAWDPLEPGYADNPWPHYARLVEDGVGLHEWGFYGAWRYHHVSAVLRAGLSVQAESAGPRSMLDSDPPDHTRLRSLVSKAFTPRSVAALEPMVIRLRDEAFERLAEEGGGDLVSAVAFPVPFAVISDMLGMPRSTDTSKLRSLADRITQGLEPIINPDDAAAVQAATAEFTTYIDGAIAWKRQQPADDMLSALIAAQSEGDRLSAVELQQQVILLFVAGFETTVNLLSGGTVALLNNPDQAALLRNDPGLDQGAVEELLRYDSPVHITGRGVVTPFELDGVELPVDTSVFVGIAAANRDPRQFGNDADELRLKRSNAAQHLSFSAGIHHCLGSALARLEGRLVIPELLRRFPDLALDGPVEYNGRINLRGPARVPVVC